jgi:EAL domain-containing protein (putative c-di-GMP-specific phosphodiesterase class I)
LAVAAEAGRLPELDWVCQAAAYRGAILAGLPLDMPLFINMEPATSATPCPTDLSETVRVGADRFQVVAEITERAISADPAALLVTIDRLRNEGARIAVDDVGADPASQAMMSLLQPDVIKIDRQIIQHPEIPGADAVIAAVQAEALRGGAAIVAEGIETRAHLHVAQSIGATLGQGWLFGRPTDRPALIAQQQTDLFPQRATIPATADTPFATALRVLKPSLVSRHTMLLLSRAMEDRGVRSPEPVVLLATFQHARHFDEAARLRYGRMSANTILTAVFADGMLTSPTPGVRGVPLAPGDPLTAEWAVFVIGACRAEALVARQVTGDPDRSFEVISTDNRDLILAAARSLIDRISTR